LKHQGRTTKVAVQVEPRHIAKTLDVDVAAVKAALVEVQAEVIRYTTQQTNED
jgi:hypothetical protein